LECDGGFPKLTSISKQLVEQLNEVEYHYLDRYMCKQEYCPCSETIVAARFGERANLFSTEYSNSGEVSKFYEHCYLKLVSENQVEVIDPAILTVLEKLEVENNCSGICEIPMFFFFKASNQTPP